MYIAENVETKGLHRYKTLKQRSERMNPIYKQNSSTARLIVAENRDGAGIILLNEFEKSFVINKILKHNPESNILDRMAVYNEMPHYQTTLLLNTWLDLRNNQTSTKNYALKEPLKDKIREVSNEIESVEKELMELENELSNLQKELNDMDAVDVEIIQWNKEQIKLFE